MQSVEFAIIGATGKTGARVNQRLNKMGHQVRSLSRQNRSSQRVPTFDWQQPEGWSQALSGVKSLYITYQPDLAVPQAEKDIQQLISVAKAIGVEHLVLLSGRGEDGAQRAEQQVIESGLSWNIIRASWFMQNFSESFMLDGILARELVLPIAKAREPFIDVDDIADVVVATLTRKELRNHLFEVTGPELLSFDDCVKSMGLAIGKPVTYQPIPLDHFISAAKSTGMPDDIAWLMEMLFSEVLDGRNEFVTSSVNEVLGRPARSFAQYVERTVKTGVWQTQPSARVSA